MTAIAEYRTKSAFSAAIAADPSAVWIYDPAINNERTFRVSDLAVGERIFVTNHPKRSWFAQVTRSRDGVLRIV